MFSVGRDTVSLHLRATVILPTVSSDVAVLPPVWILSNGTAVVNCRHPALLSIVANAMSKRFIIPL